MSTKQKVERALHALQAVGIESAKAAVDRITITPEDAMKMLLLTEEDAGSVLTGEQKIRDGIKSQVAEIRVNLAQLGRLAAHSPALCKKGKHITESYATGGRSGHCVTRCLACDYKQDGYD